MTTAQGERVTAPATVGNEVALANDLTARAVPTKASAAKPVATGAGKQPAADREGLLRLMSEMQRCMMSRLGPSGAADWMRLELTTAQLKTLFCLVGSGEQPMSQLAHKLGIGMPAATSLVDRLVDAGLVEREHSQTDRRVVLVRPTEAGEELNTRLRAVHEDQWRRIINAVPDESLPTVIESVKVMLEAIGRLTAEPVGEPAARAGAEVR